MQNETDTDKVRRQAELRKVLATARLARQDQVAAALSERGYQVTQSCISRDFRELGVAKINGAYLIPSQIVTSGTSQSSDFSRSVEYSRPGEALSSLVRSTEAVGPNMVVVRTAVGAASVVALAIDKLEIVGVAGTIAGDDTIMIAVRNRAAQRSALERINSLNLR